MSGRFEPEEPWSGGPGGAKMAEPFTSRMVMDLRERPQTVRELCDTYGINLRTLYTLRVLRVNGAIEPQRRSGKRGGGEPRCGG